MKQRSIEVRVGALILLAVGLVLGFVVVLGGVSFQPTYTIYVVFENPGGLTAGAPVRISGVKVGRIAELEFRGGLDRRPSEPEGLIRAVAKIERRYQSAIHDDARFLVSTQSMLGEMFLAVEPGSRALPTLQDGASVQGISPPRLDLLLSESYDLLHRAYRSLSQKEVAETLAGLNKTLGLTSELLEKNGPRIERIAANVETLSSEALVTLKAARERYVDGPQMTRILNNVERSSDVVARDLEPLMTDTKGVLSDAKKITRAISGERELSRIETLADDASATVSGAKALVTDARGLMDRMKHGRGTAGALVMDEALYDDLSELIRDLKHNPWKLIWKE
ncbi:MAG TPA: MlaD family protein [Polyangiaceae bacterium]|nr:MlaD family protein [Polyangiaceae bacterium]